MDIHLFNLLNNYYMGYGQGKWLIQMKKLRLKEASCFLTLRAEQVLDFFTFILAF